MPIPFITDLTLKAAPVAVASGEHPITISYTDASGRVVGTSIVSVAELAEQARAMLAMAEAMSWYVHGAGDAAPPRVHCPMMRELRVGEAA